METQEGNIWRKGGVQQKMDEDKKLEEPANARSGEFSLETKLLSMLLEISGDLLLNLSLVLFVTLQ